MDNTLGTNKLLLDIKELILLGGGIVVLLTALVKLISWLRPPKITVSHTDYLGIVISASGTTPSLHLPVVISNNAKNQGVITLFQLFMRPVNENDKKEFKWSLFWKEEPSGQRLPEKRSSPIPIPGKTSVEKSIQFDSVEEVIWEPRLYELELYVRLGSKSRSKKISSFYIFPNKDRCKAWYSGPYAAGPLLDNIPVYAKPEDVPMTGK